MTPEQNKPEMKTTLRQMNIQPFVIELSQIHSVMEMKPVNLHCIFINAQRCFRDAESHMSGFRSMRSVVKITDSKTCEKKICTVTEI